MKIKDSRSPFERIKGEDIAEIFSAVPTPAFILDEAKLEENAKILYSVANRTKAKVLLAQKAFSNYNLYPLFAPYLDGTEASGLYEARLGKEEMPNGEVHVFCAAYSEKEFEDLLKYADHIVFNSPRQLEKFGAKAKAAGKSVGLRINPECSTQEGHEIYDPCAKGSRLGTTRAEWNARMTKELIEFLDGFHFHTLCEQNSDDLETTLNAVAEKFGDQISKMRWLNFGGGHHITRDDYDIHRLESCITRAEKEWNVQVYLEPGEAWALNAGYMLTEILDLPYNDVRLAIVDASAACHMPDVIEMPYTPPLCNAAEAGDKMFDYRIGGPTCLSGDVIGDYSFDEALKEGDKLLFGDMAIYTTCKTNTFNGMPLPEIWLLKKDKTVEKIKSFEYEDFKTRLGK